MRPADGHEPRALLLVTIEVTPLNDVRAAVGQVPPSRACVDAGNGHQAIDERWQSVAGI